MKKLEGKVMIWFIFTLKSILMCLALCFVIVVVKSSKNLSFWLDISCSGLIGESIKDLSPDTKDSVLKIIDSREGAKSEERLKELLGHDKVESLIKIARTTRSKSTLTSDQQN